MKKNHSLINSNSIDKRTCWNCEEIFENGREIKTIQYGLSPLEFCDEHCAKEYYYRMDKTIKLNTLSLRKEVVKYES